MQLLTILPNFTALADRDNPEFGKMVYKLDCYFEITSDKQVYMYKITPESIWRGLGSEDLPENFDIISYLEAYTVIPENVKTEILSWIPRWGFCEQIGESCVRITKPELLEEIKRNTLISQHIFRQEDNLIFYKNLNYTKMNQLFCKELRHPIHYYKSPIKMMMVSFVHLDTIRKPTIHKIVHASDPMDAAKATFGMHRGFSEESLRSYLGYTGVIRESDIEKYINKLIENKFLEINLRYSERVYSPKGYDFSVPQLKQCA